MQEFHGAVFAKIKAQRSCGFPSGKIWDFSGYACKRLSVRIVKERGLQCMLFRSLFSKYPPRDFVGCIAYERFPQAISMNRRFKRKLHPICHYYSVIKVLVQPGIRFGRFPLSERNNTPFFKKLSGKKVANRIYISTANYQPLKE